MERPRRRCWIHFLFVDLFWSLFGIPWLVFLACVPLIALLISGFLGGGDIDEPRGGHPGLFDGDE